VKNITLKKALATPCKCGGMPKLGEPDELWILICQKCGKESMRGCCRHYATNSWYAMNKGAKNTEQLLQPDTVTQVKQMLYGHYTTCKRRRICMM